MAHVQVVAVVLPDLLAVPTEERILGSWSTAGCRATISGSSHKPTRIPGQDRLADPCQASVSNRSLLRSLPDGRPQSPIAGGANHPASMQRRQAPERLPP